jgi:hypothetical protein
VAGGGVCGSRSHSRSPSWRLCGRQRSERPSSPRWVGPRAQGSARSGGAPPRGAWEESAGRTDAQTGTRWCAHAPHPAHDLRDGSVFERGRTQVDHDHDTTHLGIEAIVGRHRSRPSSAG